MLNLDRGEEQQLQAISTIYSLFGLVVGLGIAGVLTGFAQSLRIVAGVGPVKGNIRIGWLTPLLATLVIMDQTHFYITAYMLRNAIPFTYFSLLSVLGVVGTYFICSTFIFPDDPANWPDFDEYYMKVRRIVAGGMLTVKLALVGFSMVLALGGSDFDTPGQPTTFDSVIGVLFLPMVAALIFLKGKVAHLALLVLLNLSLVIGAIAPVVRASICGSPQVTCSSSAAQ